jgi:hypothetical protein
MLGIEGRSLHSYRYAWAQRARAAGMQSQPLNLGAMLSAKACDARFRNDHAMLREQVLNLREGRILGSQRQHR